MIIGRRFTNFKEVQRSFYCGDNPLIKSSSVLIKPKCNIPKTPYLKKCLIDMHAPM